MHILVEMYTKRKMSIQMVRMTKLSRNLKFVGNFQSYNMSQEALQSNTRTEVPCFTTVRRNIEALLMLGYYSVRFPMITRSNMQ